MSRPKRWTKREIKAMTSALTSFVLVNRPLSGGLEASERFAVAAREVIAARRVDIVKAGVFEFRETAAFRAADNRAMVAHLQAHPNVYGKSTPEMIERFTKSAVENERAASWGDALLARIDADGLPAEVQAFDPLR